MERSDRTLVSRKALAWATLGMLLFTFAPGASAEDSACQVACGEVIEGAQQLPLPDVELPVEVPQVELPPVEVPDAEVPPVEVPDVELPEIPPVEVPELPELPELPPVDPPTVPDPGEVVQGPQVPSTPTVPSGGLPGGTPKDKPEPIKPDPVRPFHPVSAADGITKLTPVSIPKNGSDPTSPTGLTAEATDKVRSDLLRVPSDPSERDPSLAFPGNQPTESSEAAELLRALRAPSPSQLFGYAVEAARHMAFPLALGLAVLAFLMIERRIDSKDPKLSMAPLVSEFDSFN